MVGEILKKRREELGRDLREISNTLKIKYAYLKAIEDGDRGMLPADVYVRGYIHEYARILDLDPGSIIHTYTDEASLHLQESIAPPKENSRRKKFKGRYALLLVLLALTVTAAFTLFSAPEKKTAVLTPAVEEKKQLVPKAEEVGYDLEALATDTTWMLVTIDKTDSREVLMKPGDSVKWHAKDCFFLKIGNAGGVRLFLNGKEVGKLGEEGEVVKINLPEPDKTGNGTASS